MGKGVVAKRPFRKNEFVCLYEGELRPTHSKALANDLHQYAIEERTCYHLDISKRYNGMLFTIDPMKDLYKK